METSVEKKAMALVTEYFLKDGWVVSDVSRLAGEHAGYDLLVTKDFRRLKVEVKGSACRYEGIPDLYGASVDRDRRLVADILCVCYFPKEGLATKMAIKLRGDFPPDAMQAKLSYCIRNEYKNFDSVSKRIVDIHGELPEYVANAATS